VTRAAALALARRVALGALAAGLALWATAPRGPAVSPDSAVYLSVADHLLEDGGFTQFDGAPMTRWAPLYPWLVTTVARVGFGGDTTQAARVWDALMLGVAILLSLGFLDRRVRSRAVRWIATIALLIAPMLLQCAAFVWSETTYLVLALVALRACEALVEGAPRRGAWLLVLGAALGLAALTRYAGTALVPVAILAIVLSARGRRDGALGRELGLVLGLALLPLAVWLGRNAALTGHPLGEGWPAQASLPRNAAILLHIVSLWWFGPAVPILLRLGFVAAALSAWAIALARLARRGVFAGTDARAAVAPHAAFLVSSVVLLLVWASVSGIETISDRYAAPLFPSVVLLLAWTADRLLAERAGRGLVTALGFVALVLVLHSVERTQILVQLYRGPGEWGYRTNTWEASPTIDAVRRLVPEDALVYSNAPDALYALLARKARLLPIAAPPATERRAARELDEARDAMARVDEAWIIEFDAARRSLVVPAGALASDCAFGNSTRTRDGVIYRVRSCSGAADDR
jgi:4-amino-4-deoxy-L-arabinose transferase-like glycosyltransferase